MTNRAEARELVEHISKNLGHLSQDFLDQFPPDTREIIVGAMVRKDRLIASAIMTYVNCYLHVGLQLTL